MTTITPGQQEMQGQPEGNKPTEAKPVTVRQRFERVKQRVTGTAKELKTAWEKMALQEAGVSLINEGKHIAQLHDQLDTLARATENGLGITTEQPEERQQELLEEPLREIEKPPERPISGFAKKEAIVKQFLAEKESIEGDGLFGTQQETEKAFQESIENQNKKRGIVDKLIKRKNLVRAIKSAGVQDPEKVVTLLDNTVLISQYGDLSGENIAELMRDLDPQDEQTALAKLGRGLQAFRKLNLSPDSRDFKTPGFLKAVVTLANTPDEVFQQTIEELDQYKFLTRGFITDYSQDSKGQGLVPGTKMLLSVFEQGGLTQEQRALLEQEKLYRSLNMPIPIVRKGEEFCYSPDLADALQPHENYVAEFYPYVVDYVSTRIQSPARYRKPGEVYPNFIIGLDSLRREGQLPNLRRLVEDDWNCTQIYAEIENKKPVPESVIPIIEQAANFAQDAQKVAWVQQFQEAMGGSPRLGTGIVNEYEFMYQERESLEDFNTVLQALPGHTTLGLADIISVSDGALRIKYELLGDVIKNHRLSSDENERYASLLGTILNTLPENRNLSPYSSYTSKKEYLPLFAFLATQKDQLEELTEYGRPKAALVEQVLNSGITPDPELLESFLGLCIDPQNLPPRLAWQYMFSSKVNYFENTHISEILNNLPDSFIETLPLDDKHIIGIAKELPVYAQAFLLKEHAAVVELLKDGKPTADLLTFLGSNFNTNVLDSFLTDDILASFSLEEKQFWQTFKDFSPDMRRFLFSNKSKYQEFFDNGKPTVAFINDLSAQGLWGSDTIIPLLEQVDIESFPADDKAFWGFYKKSSTNSNVQRLLLSSRDQFASMVVDGKPTPVFLTEAAAKNGEDIIYSIYGNIDWNAYPKEKPFWDYYIKSPPEMRTFLNTHRDKFDTFIVDGHETRAFYQVLAADNSHLFVRFAQKEQWRLAFGEERVNKFLDGLPKQSDEKRNAFTHNEYDRTTRFIDYLLYSGIDFRLTEQDIEVLTDYVRQFGLSKTPVMFHYFKNLTLLDQEKIDQLPDDVEQSGIRSVQEMINQVNKVREKVYGQAPMTDLSGLSSFETEMLRLITGKSTHRFDSGRQPMEKIVADFQSDMAEGAIEGLPEGYRTEVVDASNIRIEFNKEAIQEDYDILKNEILTTIENPNDVEGLKGMVKDALQRKMEEIQQGIAGSEGKKLEFMQKEAVRFEEYVARLDTINDFDSLMGNLLEMNFDKTEQRVINGVFRRIIFGKVFQKNFSPGFVQGIQMQLEGDMSASAIESMINIIDDMAKNHALNLGTNNKEGYWSDEIFAKIKGSKRGRDLSHSFSPHIGKLREEVEQFEKIQLGSAKPVQMIPDRGFVGEMSGYLADVCYTREYPLLKTYPNVVPYKFVTTNPDTGESEFIGSVLVFEVEAADGQPSMLVRGFDVPNESAIDIDLFIEQFLDKLADVGKQRGKTQILVPGDSGAISNYQMTLNHMLRSYKEDRSPVTLAERFAFNDYDLTNNSYVARTIGQESP